MLGRRLGPAALVIASALAGALPVALGYWAADRLGEVWYRCAPQQRASVRANLRNVLGGRTDSTAVHVATRDTFRHSARNFFDLLVVRRLSAGSLAGRVAVQGSWAPAEAALARGTGVIFVFAHLGAFDAVLQLLPLRGYRSSTIGAPAGPALLQRAATALRASRGFAVEDPTPGGLRRLARALRRGEVVALAADRDFQGTGVPVRFFGAATTLPGGAVRLALATGAILVVVGCRRHGGRHTLTIDAPLALGGSGDPALDLHRGVAAVAAALERHIAVAPEQWAMFQPVWPNALVPTSISSPSRTTESA
jgi:KDO2-lipid IV(A) lauroyltransferase